VALEDIIQQDAAFDPTVLFESRLGRTNDPVGNSLVTGGPPRLIEESLKVRGGVRRTTRRGTLLDASQQIGLLDSNSNFFDPLNQGNARLGVSLTQPLFSRSGRYYNERLLTQARIDGNVSWQEMRGEVERNVADVITAYWRLYELRCYVLQQADLLRRSSRLEEIVKARRNFDAGELELTKVRQRVARRTDRQVEFEAEVRKQQTRLASLVGSQVLVTSAGELEMIPLDTPEFPEIELDLRDAVVQGLENRPEVRAAAAALETAALSIQVTRAELTPQINAVVEGYLAGLNGNSNTARSFTDQFTAGGPGLAGGLLYEMPYARRAAKSRHREAHHLYQQRSEELREAIQLTRAEIENAVIDVETKIAQLETRHSMLVTAIDEEHILTRRWERMADDGSSAGVVLENLLDAQQRRTDAEREWTSAKTEYLMALVELQRAMGTLLTRSGIEPVQQRGDTTVDFIQTDGSNTAPKLLTPLRTGPLPEPTLTDQALGDTK
jgi:outer membrane protein TolC